MERILHLLIVLVCSNNYIGNPYLLAKLVEVIFVMNPAVQPRSQNLNEKFLMHPLALQHLVPALMNFYTGNYTILESNTVIIALQNRQYNLPLQSS